MNFTTKEIEELEAKLTEEDYDEIAEKMIKAITETHEGRKRFVSLMLAGFKFLDKQEAKPAK